MVFGILTVLLIVLISLIAKLGMTAIVNDYARRHWSEDDGALPRKEDPATTVSDGSCGTAETHEKLDDRQSGYQNFFEVSSDAFVILEDGKFVDCNKAALKLFGFASKEELCQVTPAMVSPRFQQNGETSEAMERRHIEEALKKGVSHFEWLHQRKDRTIFPVEVTLNTLDERGRTIIHSVMRDITARKKEKAALQRSREELEMILNSVPFGVAIIGKDKRIHKVNRAAREMIGYHDDLDLVGHICHKAFCPAKEGQCPVLDLGKIVDESEKTLVTRLGQEKPILKSVIPIIFEGKEYLLESFVDISAQKHNEKKIKNIAVALEASNRSLEEYITIANSATRAKSEFLANMSHEIRTPMTAILGFADLLKEKFSAEESVCPACGSHVCHTGNIEHVNTIYENGQHLLRIMNDILDLSKIEAEKIDIEHVPCSPKALMKDIQSLMQVRAKAKDLPIELEYADSLLEKVRCDKTRIRQVLINLLANAIKFTETGNVRLIGSLIDNDEKKPFLRFDVVDTGIGMSEEQINNIFKPFEQGDSSTSRKFGGTGLGLTISKRLAELLGGDLVLTESVPGKGSTFTFTASVELSDEVEILQKPSAKTPVEKVKPAALPEETRLDCRVLLAEDGVDNQRLISLMLKHAGAEVVVAENGKVAFETAMDAKEKGNPFDVVLMDMQMPVMDGYEAVRKLRHLAYSGPIIALTAHAMSGDSNKCKEAGCDDYLAKPIDKKSFLAMITKYEKAKVMTS